MKKVRALPADQGGLTPAIALTAYVRSEDRIRAVLVGYQDHVSKPVRADQLPQAVAAVIGRRGALA